MFRVDEKVDQWKRLEVYRQRYTIDDRLDAITSLEKSLYRRELRSSALTRRLSDLREQIREVRSELETVESEIERSRLTGALLLEEILDQVQIDMGEAWSPSPVLGYRVWRIEENQVMGNQLPWPTPTMHSRCLREIPGEDLPHPVDRCGPPACGVYAVKDLDMFPAEVADGEIRHSVVGVVAMSGKVIEHEDGYRAGSATAVAIAANDGHRRLATADPALIGELFENPERALADPRPVENPDRDETREFLESVLAEEEKWI